MDYTSLNKVLKKKSQEQSANCNTDMFCTFIQKAAALFSTYMLCGRSKKTECDTNALKKQLFCTVVPSVSVENSS